MNLKSLKSFAVASIVATSVLAPLPTLAADEVNVAPGMTYVGAPLGLHGSDPVALLDHGKNLGGVAAFTGKHDGVAYYFASQENLDAFEANPARYIPQNGSFCTYGVSVGKKFDGDPEYSAVVDGKLYVFLNKSIFELFEKDKAGTISKADKNWKKIKHIAATEL